MLCIADSAFQTQSDKDPLVMRGFAVALAEMQMVDGKVHYNGDAIEDYDYNDRPHEIEARESEDMLYDFYLADRV